MKDDKIKKILIDKLNILNKLENPTPSKHTDHPETYKAFLNNELRLVNSKLERLRGI